MKQETKKPNKLRFWIGMIIVIIVVLLMLTGEEEFQMWPIPFGTIGIVFIGTSRYKPMK